MFALNFNKTFLPVAAHTSVMAILNLAVQLGLLHRHYDAEKAYLSAKLPQRILCKFPNGQSIAGCIYVLALCCIYGLKQAGHHWAKLSHENIMTGEPRFTRSLTDENFYFLCTAALTVFLISNVDDYAIFSSDESWYADFERRYSTTGTTLICEGPLERWCGQDIITNKDGTISLSQKYDILATIQDMPGIAEMRPVDTPMESNFHHLSSVKNRHPSGVVWL